MTEVVPVHRRGGVAAARWALLASAAIGCAQGGPGLADGGVVAGGSDAAAPPDAAPPPPDADTCTAEPCALVDQCGCGSAQVCDLDGDALATGGTTCRDVTSPGTELAGCSVSTECAGGFVCLGSPGQCRSYCDPAVEATCPEGGYCIINVIYDAGGGEFMDVPGAVTCTKSCIAEAAAENGCPADPAFGCRLFFDDPDATPESGDEYFLTDCSSAPATGGGHDAECPEGGVDCAPGFGCVTFGGTDRRCRQTCVYAIGGVQQPSVCGTGSCSQFSAPRPLIGEIEYGFCN